MHVGGHNAFPGVTSPGWGRFGSIGTMRGDGSANPAHRCRVSGAALLHRDLARACHVSLTSVPDDRHRVGSFRAVHVLLFGSNVAGGSAVAEGPIIGGDIGHVAEGRESPLLN